MPASDCKLDIPVLLHPILINCLAVQGLYVVTDMYPFHLQARKVSPSR